MSESAVDKPPVKISPMNDVFMSSLWCDPDNKLILMSLLNCVLTCMQRPRILDLSWLSRELLSKKHKGKKTVADVLVKDETGRQYIIEIQRKMSENFMMKMLYIWSRAYAAQMSEGERYDIDLLPVMAIAFVEFCLPERFRKSRRFVEQFTVSSTGDERIELSDHLQIVFVRLGDFWAGNLDVFDMSPEMKAWIDLFSFGIDWEGIDMASVSVLESPVVMAAYKKFLLFKNDPYMSMLAEEVEAELLDRAVEKAWRDEVRAEGKAEGKAEGMQEAIISIIQNMKEKGKSLEDISEVTGLPLEEIAKL